MWETFEEEVVREKAQEFIQQILEEEVTELLGREKSERRRVVDATEGYRNGYGKPRRLAMSSGTITLRRPRVRGVEERFESRVLPLFARRTKELGALLPELYLHGLAEGDFELAMRGLLGEGAPLSKSSIRRLRAGWTAEFEEWSQRRLEGREVVYVWADGIYVKAGLERDKAALLVVLGAMRDGTKEVLALRSGYRESVESWSEVLRDLKARGIEAPRLLMADGNAAIWGAVRQVWPEAGEQRCWNHKMRNEAAVDTIRKLVQMKDDVLLAAGTVVNTDKAERAIDAGAQVIVSPGTFPDVIQCCFERDIQVLPGVATATEVGTALGLGANVLKFFPAELSGGVATLKALGAVYPGVRFVPTGGISALNLEAYLSAPEVLACGGSWLVNPDVVDRGGYDRIAQMARETVAIVQAIRGKRRRRAATS